MARQKRPQKATSSQKPPLTHFLCLPLVTAASKAQLLTSWRDFQQLLASQTLRSSEEHSGSNPANGSGTHLPHVHPKAIRPVGALHCTLGVMSLSKDDLSRATSLLQSLDIIRLLSDAGTQPATPNPIQLDSSSSTTPLPSLHRSISPPPRERSTTPLQIDLKGLESMHPSHKTSILYIAPADSSARLYPFCQAVQQLFRNADLLAADERPLKLHATVVNTIYAKSRTRASKSKPKPSQKAPAESSESEREANQANVNFVQPRMSEHTPRQRQDDRSNGHGPSADAPLKMDAAALLERFKDFVWAEGVTLDRIAICEMGAKKLTDGDGSVIGEAYTEVAYVSLPS